MLGLAGAGVMLTGMWELWGRPVVYLVAGGLLFAGYVWRTVRPTKKRRTG